MSAEILTGPVDVGDRVAYGVRDGNHGGLRVGTVIEIEPYASKIWDHETRSYVPFTRYRLRVEVEETSTGRTPKRSVWLEKLDRVAKLS